MEVRLKNSSEQYRHRDTHLDGIRGIAAVAVALLHFCRAFQNNALAAENIANKTLLSALWNGYFAVAVFFALSGYLFFDKFYCKPLKNVLIAGAKRYFRLAVPILAICIAAYLIHRSGLFYNSQAASFNGSDWLARWYNFDPSVTIAINEALWKDFLYIPGLITYNSNLWTISYELTSVLIVMAVAYLCKYLNTIAQYLLLTACLIASYKSHTFEFFLGALAALIILKTKPLTSSYIAVPAFLAALSLGCISFIPKYTALAVNLLYPFGAALLLLSASSCAWLKRKLSNTLFLRLGQHSFGIYLTHFLTINSLAAFSSLHRLSVATTFCVFALSTAIASILFTRFVDEPWTLMLNRQFKRLEAVVNSNDK